MSIGIAKCQLLKWYWTLFNHNLKLRNQVSRQRTAAKFSWAQNESKHKGFVHVILEQGPCWPSNDSMETLLDLCVSSLWKNGHLTTETSWGCPQHPQTQVEQPWEIPTGTVRRAGVDVSERVLAMAWDKGLQESLLNASLTEWVDGMRWMRWMWDDWVKWVNEQMSIWDIWVNELMK